MSIEWTGPVFALTTVLTIWFHRWGHSAFGTAYRIIIGALGVSLALFALMSLLGWARLGGNSVDFLHLIGRLLYWAAGVAAFVGAWQVFRHVTTPLAWSALLTGLIMAWARAMGEFGATIIFAGNYPGRTQTMPLAILTALESDVRVAVVFSDMSQPLGRAVGHALEVREAFAALLQRRRGRDRAGDGSPP